MTRSRLLFFALVPVLVWGLGIGLAHPALADPSDITVGGVWVAKITRDAAGLTADQRIVEVHKRITDILSNPAYRHGGAPVTVRPIGQAAGIFVGDQLAITVAPEDAAGTGVTPMELARQWAQRLARGLAYALPDANVHVF